MNYFLIKERIKFWWHAHTAHGIHSPFVYEMVTQCLRNPFLIVKPRFYTESIPKKYNALLNRILYYYNINTISTQPDRPCEALISQNFDDYERIISLLDNNQFWFVLTIRKNSSSFENWKKIMLHPDIQVTIDLFLIGIVLKRSQQVKENFQLKPKF